MQKPERALPVFLNMDSSFEQVAPNESPFVKNVESGINANPSIGSNNPTGEGQNAVDLTPSRSNVQVPGLLLPAGYNKMAGKFDSVVTNETYILYYNDQSNHSIWVLSGDTGLYNKIIQDTKLPITADQEAFFSDHRVKLRVIYDNDKKIIEKYFIATNGSGWQLWINVIAAIATGGFDANLFPYYTLVQPHFDRRELFEWAMRPPMMNPMVTPIPNTSADAGTINRIIDQAFQFAIVRNNTDGRPSTYSPYSLPLIIKSEDFLNSPDLLPKKALLTLDAGSCMTESIDIMVRFTAKKQLGIPSTSTWGEWQKYIRIYKYSNQSDVLQTQYWLRTNPWANFSYDPIQNTIQYVFDNSVLPELTNQDDAARLQNDIPIQSVSLTDVNADLALGDNLYGYNNLPATTIENVSVEVLEDSGNSCKLLTRKVQLYAVATRPGDRASFESMVGYYVGTDTQVRWGGIEASTSDPAAGFSEIESKEFGLDFADHSAFVCYAKGTPYYVVGEWYQVDSGNNLTKLPALLDFSNLDVLQGVNNIFLSDGYFICVFTFELPAGRYDFAIGRHNVNLSADFKDNSTYVMGIANSRIRLSVFSGLGSFITPDSLVSYKKEIEVDCTNGDVDVWGDGADVFLIFSPFTSASFLRFIEGYLKESPDNQLGVELFPYISNIGAQYSGSITDKNGFYFIYVKGHHGVDTAAVGFVCKLNCTYPTTFFILSIPDAFGPINNGFGYLTDHNSGVVGDCNRILITGRITDLTGLIPYQNVAISIANGSTVLTASDGTFTLIVHNGQNILRVDNIYVSGAGNFLVLLNGCAPMPLTVFNESLVPCFNCLPRKYPFPVVFKVIVQGGTKESLKQNASYQITMHVADLAGRLGFENVIQSVQVPSFIQRQDTLATFLKVLLNGALDIDPEFAWIAFSVSNQVNVLRYFEWVGDSMKFIDNQGNVVDDPSTAVFISIAIDSLYNYNVSKNFSVLASYQFSPDDRIRFIDDGNGNLLTSEIDLPILGTNYNQAMQTAGIVPPSSTVPIITLTNNNAIQNNVSTGGTTPTTTTSFATTQNNISITLFVKFDSRLAALKDNTGFWIEVYTPTQQPIDFPYNELQWYPLINGEIAVFKGIVNGQPVFTFPTEIVLPFWDTYLYFRSISIPNVGDKFLNHPFESPNISDSFGANVSSGGRKWEKNDDALQQWVQSDIIKSDAFIGNGIITGIGTFRASNRKDFSQYPFGAIQAMHTERSIILVVCEKDWFTVSFDFHFTFPNPDGVMVTNLDKDISTPSQKIGSNFGMAPDDTATFVPSDHVVFWYDKRNAAWVFCDYRNATDVSDIVEERGGEVCHIGIKSYFIKKSQFITNWNQTHGTKDRFDVVAGVDSIRKNIHITFRPRRSNSNDVRSYVNKRRNTAINMQETVVYNIDSRRWKRMIGFTPEGYAELKGQTTGIEFISFAAGQAYFHNSATKSFLNFYGVQTEPVFMALFNKPADINKVLVAMSYDTQNSNPALFSDLIYTSFFNSFTYIPANYFKLKAGEIYSQVLRDMNSYPSNLRELQYLSMLQDGKRIYDVFFVIRMVGFYQTLNKYFQMNNMYAVLTEDKPSRK